MEAQQSAACSPGALQLGPQPSLPLLLLGHDHLRGPRGGAGRVPRPRLPRDAGQPPGGLDTGRDTPGPLPGHLSSSQVSRQP